MAQRLEGEVSKDIISGVVITGLICSLSAYTPIIGFVFALFIPLPVLFYRSKLGRKGGSLVPIATAALLTVVFGGLSFDILFFAELLLLGFVLSELFECNLSIERTVLYASGAVVSALAAGVFFYSLIAGTGIGALVADYVARNVQLTLSLYQGMGVPEETIHTIRASMANIEYVLVRVIPGLVIMSALFVAWTSILLARPVFAARNLPFPDFGPLNRWQAPEILVWGVIASAVLLFIPLKGLKMLGVNGLMILTMVYFFQGIGIAAYFFEKKRFPRLLRVFLYSLIGLQQFVVLIVIAFGFFDVWVDFRKLGKGEAAEP